MKVMTNTKELLFRVASLKQVYWRDINFAGAFGKLWHLSWCIMIVLVETPCLWTKPYKTLAPLCCLPICWHLNYHLAACSCKKLLFVFTAMDPEGPDGGLKHTFDVHKLWVFFVCSIPVIHDVDLARKEEKEFPPTVYSSVAIRMCCNSRYLNQELCKVSFSDPGFSTET